MPKKAFLAPALLPCDREIGEPHVGQRVAQFAHRRHFRVGLRQLSKRIVRQIELGTFERGAGDAVPC